MTATDVMPLLGYDHIEFWVGNAKQSAHYYRTAFGFTPVAYAGPETGVRDRCSWVLEQGDIRFVVTAGLSPDSPVTRHHLAHGDGVRVVAFAVPDARHAFARATGRGAAPAGGPRTASDDAGTLVSASVQVYGDTVHTFVERGRYSGVFAPGYVAVGAGVDGPAPLVAAPPPPAAGLETIDHVVCNVPVGEMSTLARWYEDVLGFTQLVHYDDQQIATEYSALMSKVLWDGHGRIKLPVNEPAAGRRRSQIDEFLEFYGGAGVQHVALATSDIVGTVAALRDAGVRFMRVPATYYADVRSRLDWDAIDADVASLAEHSILVDTDDEGYLLQIFTEPVQDRPTVFYEIIERRGARGFGVGNFKALFEAIEREQAARGNL